MHTRKHRFSLQILVSSSLAILIRTLTLTAYSTAEVHQSQTMPGTASFTTQQTEQGAPSKSRDNASDDTEERESGSFNTSAYGRVATETIKTEDKGIKAEHMNDAGIDSGDDVTMSRKKAKSLLLVFLVLEFIR
jgi:hypothetical protein